MKPITVNAMIRHLVELIGSGQLSSIDQSFIRSAAETSLQGSDTARLSDKQAEMVHKIYLEHV